MSTHNDAKYLRKAVESILNQSFKDFEFIIIDDNSTDETTRILDSYQDKRIIRLNNESNLRLPKSLNKGLEIARGEFIARMDSDDLSHPMRLERQLQFLNLNPEIDLVGTNYYRIDSQSDVIGKSDQPLTHNFILWRFFSQLEYPIDHPTILAKRSFFDTYGKYNVEYIREQDTELFLRSCRSVKYANLPDHLYYHRLARNRVNSDDVYIQSYNYSIEIRHQYLPKILERQVAKHTLKNIYIPQKRRRRQALGIDLTVDELEQSISLWIEIRERLVQNSQLSEIENHLIRNDLAKLILTYSHYSLPLFIQSSNTHSIYTLLKILFSRLKHRIRSHL